MDYSFVVGGRNKRLCSDVWWFKRESVSVRREKEKEKYEGKKFQQLSINFPTPTLTHLQPYMR